MGAARIRDCDEKGVNRCGGREPRPEVRRHENPWKLTRAGSPRDGWRRAPCEDPRERPPSAWLVPQARPARDVFRGWAYPPRRQRRRGRELGRRQCALARLPLPRRGPMLSRLHRRPRRPYRRRRRPARTPRRPSTTAHAARPHRRARPARRPGRGPKPRAASIDTIVRSSPPGPPATVDRWLRRGHVRVGRLGGGVRNSHSFLRSRWRDLCSCGC
jgi:hypothetical protein